MMTLAAGTAVAVVDRRHENTRDDAPGTVMLTKDAWLGGAGVDVFSNGASPLSTYGNNYATTPSGTTVYTGYKWQCVELVNRLYVRKGWTSSRWTGNGGQMYSTAPSSLGKSPQGRISKVSPGDVIVLGDGNFGHAGIVDRVSGSTVYVINQNTSKTEFATTLRSNGMLDSFLSGYSVIGVVHRPGSAGWPGIGQNLQFIGTNTLTAGMSLYPGQYMLTGNVKAYLVMQGDGNLVLYGERGVALWSSRTNGQSIRRAVMQGDGNLVLYRSDGTAAWNSRTAGNNGARLALQNDGNLVIYSSTNTPLWSSATAGRISVGPAITATGGLSPGGMLQPGNATRSSDKRFILTLQGDGNLVLYGPGYHVLWSSATANSGATKAVMQGDGNLVLYRSDGTAVWSSRTAGNNGARLALQNDGNLVIYSSTNTPLWSTRTAGQV